MNPLKPANDTVAYPAFKNGYNMEQYFDIYWQKERFPEKDRLVYLDIYWNRVFVQHNMNPCNVIPCIKEYIIETCKKAKNDNKIIFTVCQWDDGICMGAEKPENLIVFSIGQSTDVPLPLIAEDIHHTLMHLPRNMEKDIFASFVGTRTHEVRNRMIHALYKQEGFHFHSKYDWSANIADDDKNRFVDITRRSRFGLAPRGYGPSSFRFFEIMQMGVIPVYIHDGDNALPYKEYIDYEKFSVSIHIDNIHTLPSILRNITDGEYERMVHEMEKVSPWFTPEGMCFYVKQHLISFLHTQ